MNPGEIDSLREEVVRLRDWRHNVASPRIAAALAKAEQLSADLQVMERRLDEVERSLSRMARADEIAKAVVEQGRKSRRGILNAWEKGVLAAAALAGIASVVLQAVHHS